VSFAQQAGVSGYVKDPTGAVVPEATVNIIKTDTDAKWSTSSSGVGFYEFLRCRQDPTRYTSIRPAFSQWFAKA
jgi:hypothetical protein